MSWSKKIDRKGEKEVTDERRREGATARET